MPPDDRRQRLAAALRANLTRRKDARRSDVRDTPPPPLPPTESPDDPATRD